MSSWVVIPCLKALQGEFDEASPAGSGRDKGAEGFVGDQSHKSSSDHTPDEDSDVLRSKDSDAINEVHAYDCDSTGPWPDGKRGDIKGSWYDQKIHEIVDRERKRWLDPNDKCRLNYVIWFGQIADKDVDDFAWKPYTATSDPHTNHAHFSARYETSCENDVSPWGVADDMPDKATLFAWLDEYFMQSKAMGTPPKPEAPVGHAVNCQRRPGAPFVEGQLMQYEYDSQVGQTVYDTEKTVTGIDTKVDTLTAKVDSMNDKLQAHFTGITEGQESSK
jgi:hypothetical protein